MNNADWAKIAKAKGYLPHEPLDKIEDGREAPAMMRGLAVDTSHIWCGHPDFPDDDIAKTPAGSVAKSLDMPYEDALALCVCHDRMLLNAGGWPSGCHPEFPDDHCFYYWTDDADWSSNWTRAVTENELRGVVDAKVWGLSFEEAMDRWQRKPMYMVALALCERAYYRRSIAAVRVDSRSKSNIYIRNVPIGGPTIGIGWYPNGTCGDQVECRIDSSYSPGLHAGAVLICHEWGHNNALPHVFRNERKHKSVMSYTHQSPFQGFREGPPETELPRDKSIPQLINQYGNEPIPYGDSPGGWGFEEGLG